MTVRAEASIEIARPVADVWRWFEAPEFARLTGSGMVDAFWLPGRESGLGRQQALLSRGVDGTLTCEIVEVVGEVPLSWVLVRSVTGRPNEILYEFSSGDGVTGVKLSVMNFLVVKSKRDTSLGTAEAWAQSYLRVAKAYLEMGSA